MLRKPPAKFLIDSFEYKEPLGRNDWNEPIYSDPVTITKSRIDREAVFTSGTAGRQLIYNALIFCYAGLTEPMPEFKTEGIVIFDGAEHRIEKVIPVKEAYANKIYSYELEVL